MKVFDFSRKRGLLWLFGAILTIGLLIVGSPTVFGETAAPYEELPGLTLPDVAGVDQQPFDLESHKPDTPKLSTSLSTPAKMEIVHTQPQPDAALAALCVELGWAIVRHDLPADFFVRLIWHESRFNQRAVSPAGAQG